MLVFRYFMTISASLVLALLYGQQTTAQELFSLNKSKGDKDLNNLPPASELESSSEETEAPVLFDSEPQVEVIADSLLEAHLAVASANAPSSPNLGPIKVSPQKDLNGAFSSENLVRQSNEPTNQETPSLLEAHLAVASANAPSSPNLGPVKVSPQKDFNGAFSSENLVRQSDEPTNQENSSDKEDIYTSISFETKDSASDRKKNPAPEDLNPGENPLLFPTEKDEVEINNVKEITLEQAIGLAQRNNRELQIAQLSLEQSRERLREALAAEYPNLSTRVDFTRQDSASTELSLRNQDLEVTAAETTSTTLDGRVELNYDLYTGGRRSAQIRLSESQVRLQQLEVERQSELTRFDATNDYYNLQDSDAQVSIQQAAVEDATQTLRDAELLEQAGLGTKFDVLRAQVDLADSNQALTRAIANQRTAKRRLVEQLGLGQHVEVTAADEIKVAGSWDISLEESIILAYKNRAELEQQLVQRNIDEQQEIVAIASIRPQVSLFANYNFLGVLDDELDPVDGYTFGARVQWNFFDGGRAKARKAQSELDVEIDKTRFADQRNKIRLEVEDAYFNLQANRENIDTATIAVELATESLRLARLRFQAGVGTQTDVIDAQTELTRARGNQLRAIIDYNLSLNAIQRSVSNLPDSWLFDLP
ncbi:MAG: TolC family protein [Moorea sp. SIO2B7]|nr:TolC family protein [Moorena sp. SIO2B7]